MRLTSFARIAACLVLFAVGGALIAATPQARGPAPQLGPAEVVRLQLAALRDNDDSDQGIARAYRFASPGNREIVGSVDTFATMLKRQYADMLSQTGARVMLRAREGDHAKVVAQLQQVNGQETAYVFLLTRQQGGECPGCWMTDGVIPLKPAHEEPLYSI